MVSDTLNALHDQFAGCHTLAFADLSTQMVLVTNTPSTTTREHLDALCAEAASAFGPAGLPALGTHPASTVIIATPDHVRLYLRDPQEPADALCCVCDHTVVVGDFLEKARICLEQICRAA